MHTRVVKAKHGPRLLVRPLRDVAFEVADEYHGRGIGSALTQELVSDACAAGVVEVTALVRSDNRAAFAVLSRVLGPFELRLEGPETVVRAPLPARC